MDAKAAEWREDKEGILQGLIRVLERRGYADLRADTLDAFAGHRPPGIHWEGADTWFAADIVARRRGVEFLFQVETAATLAAAEAMKKIVLLTAFARHYRMQYALVIPASCRPEGMRKLLAAQADERFNRLLSLP